MSLSCDSVREGSLLGLARRRDRESIEEIGADCRFFGGVREALVPQAATIDKPQTRCGASVTPA